MNRSGAVDDRIRTSDADRERVTARLRDHYAEGRLTRDELDERIAATLNAKTFGELRWVLADLPEPRPAAPRGVPPVMALRPWPAFRRGPRLFPLLAIVLLTLLLVHGAGPIAIFFEVALSIVAVMFVFTTIAAITAATFFRRAHRHGWAWPHGHWHQARYWRS